MAAISEGYGHRTTILRQAEWILALDLRCAWTWLVERGCIQRRRGVWDPTPVCAGGR